MFFFSKCLLFQKCSFIVFAFFNYFIFSLAKFNISVNLSCCTFVENLIIMKSKLYSAVVIATLLFSSCGKSFLSAKRYPHLNKIEHVAQKEKLNTKISAMTVDTTMALAQAFVVDSSAVRVEAIAVVEAKCFARPKVSHAPIANKAIASVVKTKIVGATSDEAEKKEQPNDLIYAFFVLGLLFLLFGVFMAAYTAGLVLVLVGDLFMLSAILIAFAQKKYTLGICLLIAGILIGTFVTLAVFELYSFLNMSFGFNMI